MKLQCFGGNRNENDETARVQNQKYNNKDNEIQYI